MADNTKGNLKANIIHSIELNNAIVEKSSNLRELCINRDPSFTNEDFTQLYKDLVTLYKTTNGFPFSVENFKENWDEYFKYFNSSNFKEYCTKYDLLATYDLSKDDIPLEVYTHCYYISKYLCEQELVVWQNFLIEGLATLILPGEESKSEEKKDLEGGLSEQS